MNGKRLRRIAGMFVVLTSMVGSGALAWNSMPEHFKGTINDFTPLNTAVTPTGPYEMRGHWSLDLKRDGKADFSLFMTMELSDYYLFSQNKIPLPSDPTIRGAHTHHIKLTDAKVTQGPSDCPVDAPTTTPRFEVSGPADFITGNGNSAPFEKNGPTKVTVCVTGGSDVAYSNMTMVLTGPATGHFGTQPIHGVVRFVHKDEEEKH
jgi:hypothetical protein